MSKKAAAKPRSGRRSRQLAAKAAGCFRAGEGGKEGGWRGRWRKPRKRAAEARRAKKATARPSRFPRRYCLTPKDGEDSSRQRQAG